MNELAARTSFSSRPVFKSIVVGLALAGLVTIAPQAQATTDTERSAIGLKIAPVPLNLTGLDKSAVGLGSYLVTVASCNGCHTNPEFKTGSNPFNGDPNTAVVKSAYFAGGVSFGPVCSANITPDAKGLPAGLTLAHFLSAMHTGHIFSDPKGQLLQVMPWPYFRHLATDDLKAIYTYLQALPSNKTKACS
jgi:hypothetical protein